MRRQNIVYPYQTSADQASGQIVHHPVVIVGGGLTGLCAAVDLAQQGIRSVVLDDNNTVSVGSRALCFSKRSLEICDRLGVGDRLVEKGVTWQLGKILYGDELLYEFNLLPEQGHKMPAFINLQQYYFEEYFVERCHEFDEIDLRWLSKASNIQVDGDRVLLDVITEDGVYQLSCDYLIAADGANSGVRRQFGLEFVGQEFKDHFLIADVIVETDFPTERRFWFDAPFHPRQSTLLHKQPDNMWRIDFQLGHNTDPERENEPERVKQRVKAMLGDDVGFELEWTSVYTFQCRKLESFIHKERVFFVGDSAHQVSPFGARGGNAAIQGVDNLCWKLTHVLKGQAPKSLLSTYDVERQHGADENILNSTRATDFITPKNHSSRVYQKAVLELSREVPFSRSLLNSGRLSVPCSYEKSPLNSRDVEGFSAGLPPGEPCMDAPVQLERVPSWLLNFFSDGFTVLLHMTLQADVKKIKTLLTQSSSKIMLKAVVLSNDNIDLSELAGIENCSIIVDVNGKVCERYDLNEGGVYLIRPDQHVCGRWRAFSINDINQAVNCALGVAFIKDKADPEKLNADEHSLDFEDNFEDADSFYYELVQHQSKMNENESQIFNAKLVLILANQIGDKKRLSDAMAMAKKV